MPLGRLLALLAASLVAILVGPLLPVPASGAAELTLSAPGQYADRDTTLTVSGAAPGADIILERWDGSSWRPEATLVADDAGTATAQVAVRRQPSRNRLRATSGEATGEYRLPLRAIATRTRITGPRKVVDETAIRLTITRLTSEGTPVPGKVVLQRVHNRKWKAIRNLTLRSDGTTTTRIAPRGDTRWRVVAPAHPWAARSVSPRHDVDNLPPGKPVSLPGRAPRPRVGLPPQARATGAGPNPVITRIPDKVWRNMVGRSWHRGCPVGRAGLRLLRINYWDFTGYRRRGELVAAASVIRQMSNALADMYRAKLPIRSMYRVDRFGWSGKLNGANDYRSMAADNTSAFNCRWVVGRPGVRSPHSYGRSLDVNPWENPYRSSHGWTPNGWWPSRSHGRVAWRSRQHQVVRIMNGRGLRWTYGYSDLHHFDAVPRGGRLVVVPGCGDVVCH
ncbi:M15 family metallopeptidase [Nocardioides sp. J54]|uniref:M15 family metallopeptidase n=1 Tax=Nocardioides sp. J54 TaxID=935866 RepID=UPI0004B9ABD2|nr:M15 family metallopeptidase [Nocardioides sp. J54]